MIAKTRSSNITNVPSAKAAVTTGHGDERPGDEAFRAIDRMRAALVGQWTGGISPTAVTMAMVDWASHLATAQGKRMELAGEAARQAGRLQAYCAALCVDPETPPLIEPAQGDYRFNSEQWQRQPFSLWAQAFLLTQQWWDSVTHNVPGVTPHHAQVVAFAARQLLDMFSPSNIPFANPEVVEKTVATGGANLIQGFGNWLEDAGRLAAGQPAVGTDSFAVGRDVAVTPGKVIYRNRLIELIQYSPATQEVVAEPVLIVPAWIMKYYILDLSPQNSLVRHLVEKGFTVFCISWLNPTAADRDLALDDYRRMGVMAALEAINAVVPGRGIHATGYCLGGTLLSIAAAAMGHSGDDRLASVTLFAAQTDFSEPGELALFVDHSQLHFLESMMWNRGYLSADQMAGAFQLLRSNDLVWSRVVHDYLMGERKPINDLMAWNADSTHMPYRMHAEYLKRLYLDNELAAGRFMVEGRAAAVQNIRVPMFVVATERDHVAPWQSVYKIHQLADTDVTFVLTSGGHNAGIVSEPGLPRRRYRIAEKRDEDLCLGPEDWVGAASLKNGSWWVDWVAWLVDHSVPERQLPPGMGSAQNGYPPLTDAPGTYVLQR